MNRGKILSIILVSFTLALLTSCGSSGGRKKGGGTTKFTSRSGWKPNDQRGWFFNGKPKKNDIKGWPGMVYVEGGSFTMGMVKDDVMHDWNNTPRRMQVRSYFIGETEITNYEYREYLTWLKVVFPPEDPNFQQIYEGSLPDAGVFHNKLSKNDFDNEIYLFDAQFSYYPVVGISWLQAANYCDWLTDRANEKALIDKGILAKDYYNNEEYNYGSKTFNLDTYKNSESPIKDAIDSTKLVKRNNIKSTNQRIIAANKATATNEVTPFRLPTEAEWEYAALAMAEDREYNEYKGKVVAQNDLREKKGRNRGQYMENFKVGRGDYSGIGGFGNDGSAITSDVKKYPSNEFGIYGMFGNVAEWVADVYRPIIDDEASDFSYFRGTQIKDYIDNGSGGHLTYGEDDIEFDTMDNGKLVYKALPGQYKKEVVEDFRNYRDGDAMSSLDANVTVDDSSNYTPLYNSPERKFYVDAKGRVILEKDAETRTSKISDEVRVVKGGSWKDPIYWLDPGQRRFLHQAEANSWVGFRVAQDYQGTFESKRSRRGSK